MIRALFDCVCAFARTRTWNKYLLPPPHFATMRPQLSVTSDFEIEQRCLCLESYSDQFINGGQLAMAIDAALAIV
jgi:hypothetical protein